MSDIHLETQERLRSRAEPDDDGPTIEMHELPLHIPYSNNRMPIRFTPCDGLLFCASWSWNGAAVWNPWLRQTRWIESEEENFRFFGIGYDSGRPQKGHKIFGSSSCKRKLNDGTCQLYNRFAIYKFETNAWKCINALSEEEISIRKHSNIVSLHGNLYCPAYNVETDEYLIQSFDFSKDIFKIFCVLPWENKSSDAPAFSVFRGDRFSVLRKFTRTNKIEIWVTKDKINEDGENVVWMKFMTVSIPGFRGYHPSYFIDHFYESSLIICCSGDNENACIYIVKGNVSKKIELDLVVSGFSHCLYTPSLLLLDTK